MAALIALCLIWSILSLDMSRFKSSVVRPLMVFEMRVLTSLRNPNIRKWWIPLNRRPRMRLSGWLSD
jgi:hypothetical protein